MSEASITKDFEDISISQRDVKGYEFEVRVDKVLRNIGIEYTSNPLQNIALWKRRQGAGTDFKIPSLNWELEAKYSEAKIFPSWIKRDYIPRFSKNSFKVTIHNKNMKMTTRSLELCFLYDIYLIEIGYLRYVLKAEIKARTKANKLVKLKVAKKSSRGNGNNILDSKNESIESENKEARTDKCLELLFNYGINVVYPDSISYLLKRGNKLVQVHSSENNNSLEFRSDRSLKIEGLELISSKSSATFKDKFRTKLAKIGRFLGETMNLLKNLWYNRYGSVTLANWIPVKLKTKNKISRARSQKLFPCPFRVVVICPYHSQFYACFLLVFYEYVKRLLKYGCYDEDKIYSRAKSYLLHKMWIYKNHILAKCKCKPKSIIDDEIVDRQFRTPLSSFEPCKNYRCTFMINKKICPYLIAIEKTSMKPKQLNLTVFMNGDDQHGQT